MSFQLSREQFRIMILYDWKIGLTYKDSHARLVQAWGNQLPSDRAVLNWFHEFQRNNFSVEDAAHPGRPRTSVNEQTIDAVRAIIEDDPHSTYEQIDYVLGIRSPEINSIIHDYLKLHKVCTRWVPHQLTDDQKRLGVQFCRQSLKKFEEGQSRHVFDIITGNESWLYHYDPKTKEQSKVWASKTDPRPTKVL
jgi:histone-lysine N-methyltransferase SETMAR